MSGPTVSVVMPAYQAQATLARSLDSLKAQSFIDWEVIIVNDGSSDGTAAIAAGLAKKDARVQLINCENAGASTARNIGIARARGEWLLFLDADDTIDPDYLKKMLAALAAVPNADAVTCGYQRRDPDGRHTMTYPPPDLDQNSFIITAKGPPVVIHGIMVRRSVVMEVGSFDPALVTNEDWDLWARIGRRGTKFAVLREPLAIYWSSGESLSKNGRQMLRDAMTVMRRIRGRDPRVPSAPPENVEGLAAGDADLGLVYCLAWSAGILIGQDEDATPLLEEIDWNRSFPDHFQGLAPLLLEGISLGLECRVTALLESRPVFEPRLLSFLKEFEGKIGKPGIAGNLARSIDREILRHGDFEKDMQLMSTAGAILRLNMLRSGFRPGQDVDMVVFRTPLLRPRSLFTFSIPVVGPLSGVDLRAAIARQFSRRVTTRLMKIGPVKHLVRQGLRGVSFATRAKRKLQRLAGLRAHAPAGAERENKIGVPTATAAVIAAAKAQAAALNLPTVTRDAESTAWHPSRDSFEAWDAFYQTEDPWHYGSPYEQLKYERTLEMIPPGKIGRALELACAEGRFTLQLAPRVELLRALDISSVALDRAKERCAAMPNVEYARSDFFDDPIEGVWDLIICSEVLYYMESEQQLTAFADRLSKSLSPGGHFIHAHAYQVTDEPSHTGFDWNDPFGTQTITRAFCAATGLVHVKGLSTDLYRIDLFRKAEPGEVDNRQVADTVVPLGSPLEDSVACHVVWNGAVRTRPEVAAGERAFEIPVLMYHRIAESGPEELLSWRTTPNMFEHQLRFLRRRGFHSVTPAEWGVASRRGVIAGRPVIITFDDAYLDFYRTAWPILVRNGFSAHVFVPTGKVGTAADWDASYGTPAPLMNWEQIAELARKGCTFGSHMVSHSSSDILSSKQLLHEAVLSRATLERVVDEEVRSIAPPFGIIDVRTEQILEAAGYTQMFLDGGGPASVLQHRLLTPRIEISGFDDIATFAQKLGMAGEPPDAGDLP